MGCAIWSPESQQWYHRPMTISSPCGTATAQASPNIAFIKYWGNRDNTAHLSMNKG